MCTCFNFVFYWCNVYVGVRSRRVVRAVISESRAAVLRGMAIHRLLGVLRLGTICGYLRTAPTCDSAHSCSAVPLGDQTSSTLTRYPTQLYYDDRDAISPCPLILIRHNNAGCLDQNCQVSFLLIHWFDSTRNRTSNLPHAKPVSSCNVKYQAICITF